MPAFLPKNPQKTKHTLQNKQTSKNKPKTNKQTKTPPLLSKSERGNRQYSVKEALSATHEEEQNKTHGTTTLPQKKRCSPILLKGTDSKVLPGQTGSTDPENVAL